MANDETWQKLEYFRKDSEGDNWGDVNAISDELLLALDDFRRALGVPVHVLWGTTGRHSKGSFHYVENGACAVDVAIPKYSGTPIDLCFDALRFPFTGFGFYPDWSFGGQQAKGLHLDTRPLKWDADDTKNYRENRWIGVKGTDGKQHYLPFTFENIYKHTGGNKWNG